MTKHQLEQYQALAIEIDAIEREIKRDHLVTDTVTGSSDEYPYTKHPITVVGLPSSEYTLVTELSDKRRQLVAERMEIERFLDDIGDSQTRAIFRMRFIEGKSWQQIANRSKKYITADAIRKRTERFLENF